MISYKMANSLNTERQASHVLHKNLEKDFTRWVCVKYFLNTIFRQELNESVFPRVPCVTVVRQKATQQTNFNIFEIRFALKLTKVVQEALKYVTYVWEMFVKFCGLVVEKLL